METSYIKKLNRISNDQRQKNIISKLNLKKLPFKISLDSICSLNLKMARHSRSVLNLQKTRFQMNIQHSAISGSCALTVTYFLKNNISK